MNSYLINRKCPFCKDYYFEIQGWDEARNVYFLKCKNYYTSAGMWVSYYKGFFYQIVCERPKPRVNMGLREQSQFNKLQTPYWRLMGQKAKPQDVAYERELKRRNMTYGDAVMERSLHAENQSALPQWLEAFNQKQTYEPKYQKS